MKQKRSLIFICVLALALGVLYELVQSHGIIKAADARNFNPEQIISDFVFRNDEAMTSTQIQRFLESKNSACLENKYVLSLHDDDRDGLGDEPYGQGENERVKVSTLIKQASRIYNISPRVILATLEKEQGLVTRQDCPSWRYNTALGYGCPDSSPCDNSAYGFTRQIDYGTWHFKGFYEDTYPVPPTVPGNKYIQYNPSASCGGKTINIRNRATAALYSYTPYQPNSATLAAAPGQTVHCGAYGNLNFWRYFTDWFGSTQSNVVFKKMQTPRWMQLNMDTRKVDPYTNIAIGSTLPAGQQIYFDMVITVGGKTYLRSKHDTSENLDRAILIDRLDEISVDYTSLEPTRWMEVDRDLYKVDPRTNKRVGGLLEKGTMIYGNSKTEVGGTLYVRSQYDAYFQNQTGIPYSTVNTVYPEYGGLQNPRWLIAEKDTKTYDLRNPGNENVEILPSSTKGFFDKKIHINGKTYVTDGIPPTNTYPGTPLADLRSISSPDIQIRPTSHRAFRLTTTLRKTDLRTNALTGQTLPAGFTIFIRSYIDLDSTRYYRSAFDTQFGNTTAIPASALEPVDVDFVPLQYPRKLRLAADTRKIDPVTFGEIGGTLQKGRSLFFDTKVVIDGRNYLRTQFDTEHNHYTVIPLSLLD